VTESGCGYAEPGQVPVSEDRVLAVDGEAVHDPLGEGSVLALGQIFVPATGAAKPERGSGCRVSRETRVGNSKVTG